MRFVSAPGLVAGIALSIIVVAPPATAQVLLRDDFDGPGLDRTLWTAPTGDASFFGRTQIRPVEALAPPDGGVLRLQLDTHNPTALVPGDSFLGSEIDTVGAYSVGPGLVFEARVRLGADLPAGLVGALFSFRFEAGAGTRDELDFELLSNDLVERRDRVLTNAFDDDDFAQPGDKQFAALPGAGLDTFHVYQIRWLPDRVEWRVDGVLLRTETGTVPDAPMSIRLNFWAPDEGFSEAFDASLQPVATPGANEPFAYEIDWVEIRRPQAPGGTGVLSFDSALQLVNKDVATERWAIGRRLADGTATGNVFFPDGSAPSFVWCEDVTALPDDATISFTCWGADRCTVAPCDTGQWTVLGEVRLARLFFVPSQDVVWTPIPTPVTLPSAFFAVPLPSAPTAAPPGVGVQQCRDGTCTLISKDRGDERWSITRDLTNLTVTGNVFFPDDADPAFLWCEQTDATSATVTLACRIAEAAQ